MFDSQSQERTSSDTWKTTASPALPTFPEGTQYPLSLPKGLTLQLHPAAKRQSTARPSKPRPLHGFTRPASTPLAKAPLCPVGTVNLFSPIPAPLPSQGVILLTRSPLVPVNEAMPVTKVTTTPVNFQYVASQQGYVNSMNSNVGLPPATVQITSTLPVVCNRPVTTNGVGNCMKHLQKKAELPRKQTMPRKLLPIQSLPANATQLLPCSPISVTLASAAPAIKCTNLIKNSSSAVPSMVIIQSSTLLDTPYVQHSIDPQGLAKFSTTAPPQDLFTQPVTGLSYPGTLSRPLLPSNSVIMSSSERKEPAESEFKLKSSPVFFSHTPSPPLHLTESLKASTNIQSVGNQERSLPTVKGELVSDHQSNPLPDTVVNSISAVRLGPPTNSLLADSDTPADNSHYVLLQAPSQVGTPQSFPMPKNSQIPFRPQLHSAKGEDLPWQKATVYSSDHFSTSSIRYVRKDHLSLLTVGLPLKGAISQASALLSTDMGDNELWKEDMEAGAKVGGEDMACALFASPLLTLSESSCNPDSNLSSINHNDSNSETLENMMENRPNTEEQHSSPFNRESGGGSLLVPCNSNRSEEQVSSTEEITGLLSFTSGTESTDPQGGGEGLSKGNGSKEGEGHQNEESGGGEERDGHDKREGDGNGGRESQGNEGGDRNDDEKDGDGEREEEEEDFDELTQDEDEEEVMSSASEESVLSVPELQVCSASVT